MGEASPPIAVVSPTDHGGLVLIANAFGLCLILFFMLIRICARLFINPPFDRDDIALGVATVGIQTSHSTIETECLTGLGNCLFGYSIFARLEWLRQSGTRAFNVDFDQGSKGGCSILPIIIAVLID